MPITHISDTARWVAVYRAMETERPDAIFRDPFARRLAGDQGEAIVNQMKRGRAMAWAMIVRTAVFDEIILGTIAREQVDLVLNLAAGLDARAWRLPLPPALHWVDVDLPAILDYKTTMLRDETPACRYDAIVADLTDAAARRALFARVGADATRTLIVTEGLLIYLTATQVADLARDLAAMPSSRWWLIDLASPWLLKKIARFWGRAMKASAPFQFAPQEGTAFFAPFGWREHSFRSSILEAQRLGREMPGMWLWRFIGKLSSPSKQDEYRRMSGFPLLEKG
jgi:methyltransferase (TIGR00027 family)